LIRPSLEDRLINLRLKRGGMIGGGKERTGTTGTQTVTIAIGNPAASAMTTRRTAKLGISKKREDLRRELGEEPCDYSASDCCSVNIAPFQLREDVLWVHSACLDGALVPAPI
jgi:hypothetical protein